MSIQLFDRIRAFIKSAGVYSHENLLQNQSDINRAVQDGELINFSSSGLLDQTNLQINRMERYKDYDQMDEMGEISLALDLYADESTQIDPEIKHSISIRAGNIEVKEELERLFFDILNIDNKLRAMVRYLCKYGDFASEIITNEDRTEVASCRPFNIYDFLRVETKHGDLVGFFFNDEVISEPIFLHPWQVMHLRLTSYENIYSPYGRSILDGARKDFRRLRLMEDAALIYRICLVGNTKIWTPNGYKYIKDIQVDDCVYTLNKDETLSKTIVTNQICNGLKPTYTVITKYRSITGTATHPFLIRDLNENCLKYVDLKDLDPENHLLVTPKISNSDQEIKDIDIWYEKEYGKLTPELLSDFRNKNYDNISEIMRSVDHPVYLTRQVLYLGKGMPYCKLIELCEKLDLDSSKIDKYSPFCKGGNKLPKMVTKEFVRFIGFYMGDGYMSETNWRVGLALGSDMQMNQKYIKLYESFHERVKLEYKNEYINNTKIKRLNTAVVCDKQFYKIFESLELSGGAHGKRIPNWVFSLPYSYKIEFIGGLIDADGTTKQKETGEYYEIELCNKLLIEDIKVLCDQIGWITGKIRTRTREGGLDHMKGEYTSYCLYINPEHKVGYEKIVDITYAGDEYVYDISVENENHNFIAEGVAVHNTRAPEKRVFTIPVGNIPTNQVQQYLNQIADQFKKQRFYDPATGEVNWRYAPLIQEDDFWMPQRPDGTGPKIDTLSGAENLDQIADIEYFKKKMIAPLKIPFDRVGIGENAGGNADKSLASSHTDFSKAVQFVQQEISIGLKKVALVHLALKGFDAKDMGEFDIGMTASSAIDELYRIETWNSRAGVISTLRETGLFTDDWILKRFTNMTDDEVEQLKLEKEEQKPDNEALGLDDGDEEGGGLGDMGMNLPGLESINKDQSNLILEYQKIMSEKKSQEKSRLDRINKSKNRFDDIYGYFVNNNELDGLPKSKSSKSNIISDDKDSNIDNVFTIAESMSGENTHVTDDTSIEEKEEYAIEPLIESSEEAMIAFKANKEIITNLIDKQENNTEEMQYPIMKISDGMAE